MLGLAGVLLGAKGTAIVPSSEIGNFSRSETRQTFREASKAAPAAGKGACEIEDQGELGELNKIKVDTRKIERGGCSERFLSAMCCEMQHRKYHSIHALTFYWQRFSGTGYHFFLCGVFGSGRGMYVCMYM